MPLVFTYGPDTVQGRMYDRIGPTEVIGTGTLEGYRLVFDKPNMKNKKEGLPNIREEEGAKTFGLLFELTQKQFEALDGFFGGYERKMVDVTIHDPENPIQRPARTWIARRTDSKLSATQASLDLYKQGLEENDAPEAFLEEAKGYEVLS